MKIYSKTKINILSLIITIIIYFFITIYIPKLYKTTKAYFYYKNQPNINLEYEEKL